MGGKATGENRVYQEQCRDIVIAQDPTLVPYARDGIDIEFAVGHTSITVDIALRAPDGSLVLIECKRWNEAVEQAAVYAFAGEMEDIREATGLAIVALFYAKAGVQIGALGKATHAHIGVVECDQDQPLPNFTIARLRFDVQRRARIRDFSAHIHESVTLAESIAVVATRDRDIGENVGAPIASWHSTVTRGSGRKAD